MREREIIYDNLLLKIEKPTAQKKAMLFYHVFSLKMSGNFIYTNKEQFTGLIEFLNNEKL